MSTKNKYLDATDAAKMLHSSRPTVCRIAKSIDVGVYVKNRLVALTPQDVAKVKKNMHGRPGNPEWIAAAKTQKKQYVNATS